jgi:multiple sugar transport system substrate-binding protein
MNQRREASSSVSRRDFLRAAGIVGGAALFAACAPQAATDVAPTTEAVEEATQAPPSAEVVTISWWNQFITPLCQELFPRIVGDFEAQHPNIKVEFELTGGPPGGGDYIEVLMARIAAGNPPESITLWSPPSQFGARGALLPIDDMMASASLAKTGSFYDGPIKSCMWKGKTYGLPASAGDGCIMINTKIFEDAGISTKREDFPTTWDGMKELAGKLTTQLNGETDIAGFVPWTQPWLKDVWSGLNGGQIFDATNIEYTLNTDNNIELLDYWISYLDDLYGGDYEAFNTINTWGDVYPGGAFSMGKTAADMTGTWGATDAEIPFDFEVMKFPVGPKGTKSLTGFWPNWWAMPKGVVNPNEAWLFSEYMCTEGWVTWFIEGTMDIPAWKDAPADAYTKLVMEKFGEEKGKDLHEFFIGYLEDSVEMWTSPIEDFATDTYNQAVDEAMHKVKTPAEALASAQEICAAKLQETLESFS